MLLLPTAVVGGVCIFTHLLLALGGSIACAGAARGWVERMGLYVSVYASGRGLFTGSGVIEARWGVAARSMLFLGGTCWGGLKWGRWRLRLEGWG